MIKNIVVAKGIKHCIISVDEVMIFFYEGRNVFILTKNNEVLLCDMDLTKIDEEVCQNFFRINRQVILNAKAIDCFHHEENHAVTITLRSDILNPKMNLSVSKNKVSEFKHWLSHECFCSCTG